jgi:hypothetical protein
VLHVEVVYCPSPDTADRVALTLPAGATVADALHASGLLERHALALESLRAGVWFKVREPGCALRDRDRVEIYRPLTVDPKEARRLRYKGTRKNPPAGGALAT